MRVQDVMSNGVETIGVDRPADEAWTQMRVKGIHHLVVTKGTAIVGLLSDRDIGGSRGAALRRNKFVGELMTRPAVTIAPDAPVRRAANLMRGRSIGSLVVAEGGKVRGIVTVSDLLELLGRGLQRPAATARRWTLKHRAPHRKADRATGLW